MLFEVALTPQRLPSCPGRPGHAQKEVAPRSEVMYNMFDLVGVLVDAVGLPIDLMDVIGVFVDPMGVRVVLVDPVGLPIDLMDNIGVFVQPMGVQGVNERHGLVLGGHVQHIFAYVQY